ncbi:MAG: chemotaxis protein CheA [PVC group bacterium]|nr:chemotaxis protein CheA [PVC group bacterium]
MSMEQYRALFVTESEEHLQFISNAILRLEKDPEDAETLNTIFRSAHTLKGMAATMGFKSFTQLTHKMEDILDIFRADKIPVTPAVIDRLFKCLDMLELLLEEVRSKKDLNLDVTSVIAELENISPAALASNFTEDSMPDKVGEEKVEVGLSELERKNLDSVIQSKGMMLYEINIYISLECQMKSVRMFMIFNKFEELGEVVKSVPSCEDLEENRIGNVVSLLFLTKASRKKIEDSLEFILEIDRIDIKQIKNVSDLPDEKEIYSDSAGSNETKNKKARKSESTQMVESRKIKNIRISTRRLDNLMNLVGELVIAKIRLMQIAQFEQSQALSEVITIIDRLTSELQDEVMQARLVPISHVFDRFPRMVRDLARKGNKQVFLDISGGEIELDRTVLDEIADPLVHLLRNSVDHGIELPQERKIYGKKTAGTIKLQARRERTYVLVEVSDDGMGINPDLLRQAAVAKGFYTEDEVSKMNNNDILQIITLPGFSSAAVVTDTSGRGVGMDVVKMKIESLGGTLSFDSNLGAGSTFSLKLPLTVAIILAMLVEVRGEIYAAPIANIVETVKVNPNQIKHIEKFEVINLRDEVLPLLRLKDILESKSSNESVADDEEISILVVEGNGKKAGLVIDRFLGQQEVVIKSMGSLLKGIKGFAGATILGDGRVALILDVASLIG